MDIGGLDAFARVPATDVESELRAYLDGRPSRIQTDHIDEVCAKRLESVVASVVERVHGREDAVRAVVAALASGVPSVLLGPPGTAKSLIAREIGIATGLRPSTGDDASPDTEGTDGDETDDFYFEYLLTAHTMPEELFGPIDLKALQAGRLERNMRRMLPRAHLVFLDEVFRGSSQILNTLLTVLNEHRFHDGSRVVRVPLVGVIAASNEPPRDPDLAAFYDRFPIRVWIDSILEDLESDAAGTLSERMQSLAQKSFENERRQLGRVASADSKATEDQRIACLNDFRCVRARIVELVGQQAATSSSSEGEFRDVYLDVRHVARLSDRSLFAIRKFATALGILGVEPRRALIEAFRYTAPDADSRGEIEDKVDACIAGREHTGTV